jgi:hypothetical protein
VLSSAVEDWAIMKSMDSELERFFCIPASDSHGALESKRFEKRYRYFHGFLGKLVPVSLVFGRGEHGVGVLPGATVNLSSMQRLFNTLPVW